MTFYIGQKVVCVPKESTWEERIKEFLHPLPHGGHIVVGNIYTISRIIYSAANPNEQYTVEVAEVYSPGDDFWEDGWDPLCFRPVIERKTDISIFKKILADASKQTEAAE